MFAWVAELKAGWQIAIIVILLALGAFAGGYVTRLYYKGEQIDDLKAQLITKQTTIDDQQKAIAAANVTARNQAANVSDLLRQLGVAQAAGDDLTKQIGALNAKDSSYKCVISTDGLRQINAIFGH